MVPSIISANHAVNFAASLFATALSLAHTFPPVFHLRYAPGVSLRALQECIACTIHHLGTLGRWAHPYSAANSLLSSAEGAAPDSADSAPWLSSSSIPMRPDRPQDRSISVLSDQSKEKYAEQKQVSLNVCRKWPQHVRIVAIDAVAGHESAGCPFRSKRRP